MFAPSFVAAAVVLLTPGVVAAQDSTPSAAPPFRPGQWAMQFTAGINASGFGALRFSSPTRAVLFDVQVGGLHSHYTTTDTSGTTNNYTSHLSVSGRIGQRNYRYGDQRSAVFHTVGVSAGLTHDCASGFIGCANGWAAGVFADFGGAYFVTPHLSLGGALGLSFQYQRSVQRRPGNITIKNWAYVGSVSSPVFISTFYF